MSSIVKWRPERRSPARVEQSSPAARPVWTRPDAVSPWKAVERSLRRMLTWWVVTWLLIVGVCVAVAKHEVPWTNVLAAASGVATLVVIAVEQSRREQAKQQR